MSLTDDIPAFFAEDGPLSHVLEGYVPRAAQIEMAQAVAASLETSSSRLVVEAGTGTGKTLAYLVPALLSDQQVCVATGTKALQDQLFEKDLPVVMKAVHAFAGKEKVAALMKGRQNYLCLTRWEQISREPTFAFAEEGRHLTQLRRFVEKTGTGDRAEIKGLPEPFSTWNDLDASSEICVGSKCVAYQDCYVTRMRRAAENADIIVVNHHLLCADLRVRLEGVSSSSAQGEPGAGQVIPDVQALIIDEAHALAAVATDYFGVHFSTGRADRLVSDVGRRTGSAGEEIQVGLGTAVGRYETAFEALLERVGRPSTSSDWLVLAPELADDQTKVLRDEIQHALADLCMRLEALAEVEQDKSAEYNELVGLSRRAEQMAFELGFLLERGLKDPTFVTWLEGKKRGFGLSAAPIDVASALDATLFATSRPVVLTSATLAVEGNTEPFLDRVGLLLRPSPAHPEPSAEGGVGGPDGDEALAQLVDPIEAERAPAVDPEFEDDPADETQGELGDERTGELAASSEAAADRPDTLESTAPDDAERRRAGDPTSEKEDLADEGAAEEPTPAVVTLVLPSPFEFERRAALYAPTDMPDPRDAGFFDRFCDEVRYLVELSEGGALVLFTSYRMLERTREAIGPDLEDAGLLVFRQGDAPKLQLLEAMKEREKEGAVLFATQSFWEGVDLPGSALRMVIIDRLPFKPPTDPLQQARHQMIEAQGKSAFDELSVPEAALALKQGVGRLIRTERDTGVVAVLDGRIRSKRYGRVFLRTLPPMVRVGSRKVVKQFWERVVLPGLS